MSNVPYLITDNKDINRAYRLAIATLYGNILPFKDGILEKEEPVIIAGLGYSTPWTRDAAINVWNGGGLLYPQIALNTLKSVMGKDEKGYFIDGEYWDRIIWTIGAWWYYLYNGDKDFLKISYEAVLNSLDFFENTEFSEELNLFRGAACYGDGVAAYPDIYAKHGESGIIVFSENCKDLCEAKGVGIPMYALSTNCIYYFVYVLADKMGAELGLAPKYTKKAENMKSAINKIFWNESKKNYIYLHDKFGGCDSLEGLGLAFAILFGVANDEQIENIFLNTPTTKHGITCVHPSFARYDTNDGMGFGRHSGTVWPHVQGYWADAAAQHGKIDIFDHEFLTQTENAVRYFQFAEIYHPITGEIYGGRQERGSLGIVEWRSEPVQTWSATAYLRNVYFDLIGMNFSANGIEFNPVGSKLVGEIKLKNFSYRNAIINITIKGNGDKVKLFKINGKEEKPFISADAKGVFDIEIEMMV